MTWRWLTRGLNYTLLLVACLGGIAIALPRHKPISVSCQNQNCKLSQLSVAQLQQKAEAITVKVLSKELLGTGTLMKRNGQVYTVMTNAHVLRSADPPYQIQTPDGRLYSAVVSKSVLFKDRDLVILQFRSADTVYTVATVGDSTSLKVGDKVFVGGFTSGSANKAANQKHLSSTSSQEANGRGGFVFTQGKVSLILDKALEGGYQIAYSNEIRKGMSGAPLLNHRGEVVGINGLHKDPVWDAPELYMDGSEPSKPLQKLITRSSLGVPIKTVVQLAPKLVTHSLNMSVPPENFDSKQKPVYERTGD